MYIKWQILADLGVFDEIYGLGYNEENDLIMRANRCGYRAVIAIKLSYTMLESSLSTYWNLQEQNATQQMLAF